MRGGKSAIEVGLRRWRAALPMLPALGASVLPVGTCPACWPAYAGLLSSLGLGFLFSSKYLLPVMAVFLALAVGSLAFRAKSRRGYGPFALGLFGAALALVGKFALSQNLVLYAGLGLLMAASAWNLPPRSAEGVNPCPDCTAHAGQPVNQQPKE